MRGNCTSILAASGESCSAFDGRCHPGLLLVSRPRAAGTAVALNLRSFDSERSDRLWHQRCLLAFALYESTLGGDDGSEADFLRPPRLLSTRSRPRRARALAARRQCWYQYGSS